MFPMIAEVAEFEAARAHRRYGDRRAPRRDGDPLPRPVKVGVMLEVPSLLWQLPALLQRVDFLSVGTNDLVQFLFACDRGNPRLADRYDPLSPPMLRAAPRGDRGNARGTPACRSACAARWRAIRSRPWR